VGYDVSTVAAEINEFNWYNTSKADGGSGICQGSKVSACLKPVNPKTGLDVVHLPGQVQIVLSELLDNDPRPFFMHQSNLTGDRLAYQVMDGILSAYHAVYRADTPIVNLPMSGDGAACRTQQLWANAVRQHLVTAWVQGRTVTISGPSGTTVPVTVPQGTTTGSGGQAFGSRYAGELSQYTVLGSHPLHADPGSAPFGG
jgi:hypothetical protein